MMPRWPRLLGMLACICMLGLSAQAQQAQREVTKTSDAARTKLTFVYKGEPVQLGANEVENLERLRAEKGLPPLSATEGPIDLTPYLEGGEQKAASEAPSNERNMELQRSNVRVEPMLTVPEQ